MKLRLTINTNDYPVLNSIKEDELEETLIKIFKTGYNIHFPSIKEENQMDNINSKLELIKQEIKNDELLDKISSLEHSLNKLIGIGSNSIKKGSLAENVLDEVINSRYGDIIFERKSHIPHSGDAWLTLPDGEIIMLESKNYTATVNKDEVEKMRYDMITNNIRWAIFVSFTSNIQGAKEMDLLSFQHSGQNYYAVLISNLSENMAKLDLAIEIVRKLIKNFSKEEQFPWIVNDIKNSLDELEKIVQHNYMLRDNFYNMEKEINNSLSNYHTKLRDYQWSLENKIKIIIHKIKGTMDIKTNYNDIIDTIINDSKNRKVLTILSRLIDTTISNKLKIKVEENNLWFFFKEEKLVATIKIQQQKVIVCIPSNDMTLQFINGKEKENKKNFEILQLLF